MFLVYVRVSPIEVKLIGQAEGYKGGQTLAARWYKKHMADAAKKQPTLDWKYDTEDQHTAIRLVAKIGEVGVKIVVQPVTLLA